MRIVDIRECAAPVKSDMRNSSFDFSEMTTSVVAVITDVVREHRPVVGFAFNSTGRYACGAAMRARFIPRILNADPLLLLDEDQENFDPAKILAVMMQREKSGGHSERSIGIGTIEVAVWDAVAKIAGNRSIACWPSATTAARSRARCSVMSAVAGMRRARP
jgi:D(-)-tartrate dehydratase